VVVLTPLGGHAQTKSGGAAEPDSAKHRWTVSVDGGGASVSDSTSIRAYGGAVQYQPIPGIAFGVAPSIVTASGRTASASGLGDLPISASASKTFEGRGSPELAAALILTLPTGKAACGLGSGHTNIGLDVGAGFAPTDAAHLSFDASRDLSNTAAVSSFDAPQSTWLGIDADLDVAPRWTLDVSLGGDFGGVDTTAGGPGREAGTGVSYGASESFNLTLDLTRRLAGDAPLWGLVLTVGTAPAGLSLLHPSSALRRQRGILAGGVAAARHGGRVATCP
jgi:hypothetical protein